MLKNHVIYWRIFGHCTPVALLRFQRTCRLARTIVEDYMRVAFNINARLSLFFNDPQAFRSLQARTGTLISGSTALQFFDRAFYPGTGVLHQAIILEADQRITIGLDLFVHKPHRRAVGRWLLEAGYQFVPASYQDTDFEVTILDTISLSPKGLHALDGILTMLKFVKRPDGDASVERTKTVQLIVAENTPMEVILSTHSS